MVFIQTGQILHQRNMVVLGKKLWIRLRQVVKYQRDIMKNLTDPQILEMDQFFDCTNDLRI